MKQLKRPNVLLIYTDQQRWDSLKCYGNDLVKTPNLDRLAEEGALFEHSYVQNPFCMPSRMSMLTSQYPGNLGIGTNGIPAPNDRLLVHQVLKPYGYHAANIGKLHFSPHVSRDHKDCHPTYDFDTLILSDEPGCYDDAYTKWVEELNPSMLERVRTSLPPAAFKYNHTEYSKIPRETHEPYVFQGEDRLTHSAFIASETCSFLEANRNNRFFAIAGFYAPHTPVNPPQKYVNMYNLDNIPYPRMGPDDEFLPFLKEVPREHWKKVIAHYLALVTHVDECVGEILNKLDELGLSQDTLVIFTSDHGEYLGDHGRIQKGWPGHDVIIRVPLIMRYPRKIKRNLRISNLVESVDIVPTIIDYCGIQQPNSFQGMSLRPLIEGRTDKHKDEVIVDMFNPRGYRGTTIRTDKYKYYLDTDGNEFLFDLENDSNEFYNLAQKEKYKEIVSDMRKSMIIRLQQVCYRNQNQVAEY
ncbi:MAG: sulfatase-like hydrolase/transferase [Clostridia bacterium]|nr:sulfatase-like hydrolase/transferase [Clostridia bacterium]